MSEPQPNLAVLYVPFPNLKEASKVAKALLSARLAVCINITPGVLSLYTEGENIKETPEAIVVIKAVADKVIDLKKTLEHLHPYDTPAILELDVSSVNNAYAEWVKDTLA